jgi:hypothetical protein
MNFQGVAAHKSEAFQMFQILRRHVDVGVPNFSRLSQQDPMDAQEVALSSQILVRVEAVAEVVFLEVVRVVTMVLPNQTMCTEQAEEVLHGLDVCFQQCVTVQVPQVLY